MAQEEDQETRRRLPLEALRIYIGVQCLVNMACSPHLLEKAIIIRLYFIFPQFLLKALVLQEKKGIKAGAKAGIRWYGAGCSHSIDREAVQRATSSTSSVVNILTSCSAGIHWNEQSIILPLIYPILFLHHAFAVHTTAAQSYPRTGIVPQMILEHGDRNKDFLFLSHLWLDLYVNLDLLDFAAQTCYRTPWLCPSPWLLLWRDVTCSTLAEEKASPNGNVKKIGCAAELESQSISFYWPLFMFSFFAKWLLSEEKLLALINVPGKGSEWLIEAEFVLSGYDVLHSIAHNGK